MPNLVSNAIHRPSKVMGMVRAPMLFVAALAMPARPAVAGGSVWAQNPFTWDTVQGKMYSFCSNASGSLAPDALAALGKSKMMIHGMEEGAALPPAWQSSESKIGLAAAQLRKVNPTQLQLYTVQIDYARSVCECAHPIPSPQRPQKPPRKPGR
jgi:hypothetical protein